MSAAGWVSGLVLTALAAAPLPAATPPARSVLSRCAEQHPIIRGWKALRAACPGVGPALAELKLGTLLPRGWHGTLTSSGLAGLERLYRHYENPPSSPLPNPTALRDAARRLAPRPHQSSAPSLWTRLRRWVHGWIAPIETRLQRWLRSVTHGPHHKALLYRVIWILGGVLLTVALLAILFQLRAAGLFVPKGLRGSSRRHRASPRQPRTPPPSTPSWTALRNQPSGLLLVLIDALVRARRLDRERNLTCRELVAHARFDNDSQRRGFEQVALLAERERYGPPADRVVPESVLLGAQTLHAHINASSSVRGGEDAS